jgi:eukaryotic translation initiation factor 2C
VFFNCNLADGSIELAVLAEFNPVPFACLNSDQAAEMIKIAAQRPEDRANHIKQWRRRLNYESLPKIKAWGLEIAPNMVQVEGRVLQPPKVKYFRGKELVANFG